MKFLVYGAGSIGAYIGGSLMLAGESVLFLERPEAAEVIRGRGLRLRLGETVHHLAEIRVATAIEAALSEGPYDVAIFALKSNDTRAAMESTAPFTARGSLPPFLCLQNGVENEAILASILGTENVIAGTVTSAVRRNGPGDVVLERKRGVGLVAGHPISLRLIQVFNAAGLNATLYTRANEMKWSKLLTNLLGNATSAILDMAPAQIFAHPGLYRVEIGQLREALKVMAALDIRPIDLPGAPVRLLAFSARLPPYLSRPLMRRAVGEGRGGKMPSFHIDLHSGRRKSEVDYINGAVARFGARNGIDTPINRFLNRTLLALAARELPLDTYAHQPEKLLERMKEAGCNLS